MMTRLRKFDRAAISAVLALVLVSLHSQLDGFLSAPSDADVDVDVQQRPLAGESVYKYRNLRSGYEIHPSVGYYNLSCPFEMSKYSCAYMQRGPADREVVMSSIGYYLQHLETIQAAFDHAEGNLVPRRVFFTGDSLMRQIFIGMACNAATLGPATLVESSVVPWKDEWPCPKSGPCFVTGGPRSGFDHASVRLVNGIEFHFVPHMGWRDEDSSEEGVLDRLIDEIRYTGGVTFGTKTAMAPRGPVDVLVHNVGIHYGHTGSRKLIKKFAHRVARPLIEGNATHARPKIIYVTTPTQHYHTADGQWGKNMRGRNACVDGVRRNPREEIERDVLKPGVNVDAIVGYEDLDLGSMHVRHGHDCSHYCMPGVPDVVAARLMEEILA